LLTAVSERKGEKTKKRKEENMRWSTHRRIAAALCRRYDIPDMLADAVVAPDREPELRMVYRRGKVRVVRVPHHAANPKRIFAHLKRARRDFLRGRLSYVEHLGRALHYLQDSLVSTHARLWIFRFRSRAKHENLEQEIAQLRIPQGKIKEGEELFQDALKSEFTVAALKKVLSEELRAENNAERALERAVLLSSLLARAVTFPPERMPSQKRREIEHRFAERKKGHLLAIATLALTALALYITGSAFGSLLALATAYLAHRFDFIYHRLKEEKEWWIS
jgi:hypothetical protein